MIRHILAATFVVISVGAAPFAYAQFAPFSERVTIRTEPRFPEPGDTVQLTLSSYALDLSNSRIRWTADGKTISEGFGITAISVPAGAIGSVTDIKVAVQDPDDIFVEAAATIAPVQLDISWESTAYAPPLYKGKKLAGAGAPLRVRAAARFVNEDGTLVPFSDIIYDWYRNDRRIADTSGRGRTGAILPGPSLFGTDTITVKARSADGRFVAEKSVRVPAADTSISLYENHPLFGILYHRSLEGEVETLETEQSVTAVPYFANTRSPHDAALAYDWRVNGQSVTADVKAPDSISILTEGYVGPAAIELTLTSAADFAMRASGAWRMIFGASSANAFFNANPFGTDTN